MRIQHNIAALNSYRQLSGNNNALSKNLEKLSSGYRINRAGDDAAGLAISEKMRAQIKGLEVAQKNANDGISLVQTAEGALTEVHSMLNRMVELATQSANGTYDDETSRANLQKEVSSLLDEIDRISKATNFNGIDLLNGNMDAEATNTTGGTTDVPILQNVAKDPTTEVGSATVLHKDAPKEAKTEINVELHNVTVTSKSQVGDKISFKVGDAEVELEVAAAEDLANGVLEKGRTYTSDQIAAAIQNKFNAGDKLIGGQEFTATASGSKIKFEQVNIPQDKTEVVDANVGVDIKYVENPDGNPKEYTVKIADDLTEGAKIKIGGNEVTLTGKLSDHFDASTPTMVGDYEVTYDSGTLKIKDPNGTLKTPSVTYDGYETALAQKPSDSKTEAAAAAGSNATASITLKLDAAEGDELDIDGDTFEYNGTNWVVKGGGTSKYTVAQGASAKDITITRTAADGASEANNKVATFRPKATTVVNNTALSGGDPTTAATGSIELSAAAKTGDKLTIGDQTYAYNGTAWAVEGGVAAKYTIAVDSGNSKLYNITAVNNGADTAQAVFTGATNETLTNPALQGGVTKIDGGVKGYTEFDLSGMEEGDKLIIGDKEFVINSNGVVDTLNATALTAIEGETGTGVGSVSISADGKLRITAAADNTTADSEAPAVNIKIAKKKEMEGTVVTPASSESMSGTWNVQSTKNKQGATKNGGQLASTTFDLTKDIVSDGTVLTIGDSSYVFKVGKDSTVTSQAGQTLIDLSAYEADSAELIDKAGAALANAANNAFTIGYEKGSGKISVHEKEGQTAFTNGELNEVESFDKLIYMTAPEVTEKTGTGLTLQVGDTAADYQKVTLNIKDMSSEGLGIKDINIGTQEGASAAIDKIKAAINSVSSTRGDLGAVQNRLEHTINNLGVTTENLTAAESRIRDTDMAQEMMNYTKNNILVQAAQAMLAQANTVPQGVLQLLQ